MLTEDFWMDEDDLRAWGMPESVVPHAGAAPDPRVPAECIPLIYLPEAWSPAAEPEIECMFPSRAGTVESVEHMASTGVGCSRVRRSRIRGRPPFRLASVGGGLVVY
jgi:hypothetical protein